MSLLPAPIPHPVHHVPHLPHLRLTGEAEEVIYTVGGRSYPVDYKVAQGISHHYKVPLTAYAMWPEKPKIIHEAARMILTKRQRIIESERLPRTPISASPVSSAIFTMTFDETPPRFCANIGLRKNHRQIPNAQVGNENSICYNRLYTSELIHQVIFDLIAVKIIIGSKAIDPFEGTETLHVV